MGFLIFFKLSQLSTFYSVGVDVGVFSSVEQLTRLLAETVILGDSLNASQQLPVFEKSI